MWPSNKVIGVLGMAINIAPILRIGIFFFFSLISALRSPKRAASIATEFEARYNSPIFLTKPEVIESTIK